MVKKTKRSSVAKMGKSIELERRHYYRKAVGLMTTGGKFRTFKHNYVNYPLKKIIVFYSRDLWSWYCVRRSLLPQRERKEKFVNGWANLFSGRSTR